MSFVHLHTHSEFSLLDGANRLGDLIRRTQELEMPALALTDHGCMYGAWTFQESAKKAGIKPILGMEAYVAPGDRRVKAAGRAGDGRPEDKYYHLVLLARDIEGYRNLVKLTSIGYLEGFYHRPRIDREVLAAHAAGVIVTSACMAGEVARHLTADRWDDARAVASWYANLFEDRYYLEVQAHDTPGQRHLNDKVFRLADEMGLPVVATNDAHFLRAADHDTHDVLLCIGLGKDRTDENRMKYDAGLYFKAPDEIAARFRDRPDVITNTLAIADSVDVKTTKQYHVPQFPCLPVSVRRRSCCGSSPTSGRGRGSAIRCLPAGPSGSSTSLASSRTRRRITRATSSSRRISSTGRRTATSPWVRGAARRRGHWSRT
jgi:DNA polymerase III subunit alpha